MSAPALLIEGLSPAGALRRSQQLVKGRWFPTAGVILVAVIMTGLISAALEALIVGAEAAGELAPAAGRTQLRRLKELESENARLKRMYADLSLTHHALQDAVQKKL